MSSERGSIVIMVLWVITLLTIIGGYYAVEARTRRNLGYSAWNAFCASQAVHSMLALASVKFSFPNRNENPSTEAPPLLRADGSWRTIKIGAKQIEFCLENEKAKLDLNRADKESILKVLKGLAIENYEELAENIIKWRSGDNRAQTLEHEVEIYSNAFVPVRRAGAAFKVLNELLLVQGMEFKYYYGPFELEEEKEVKWRGGLKDIFTIYNGSKSVVRQGAPYPLTAFLDKELRDANTFGTVLMKLKIGNRLWSIFFQKYGTAKKISVLDWNESIEPTGIKSDW